MYMSLLESVSQRIKVWEHLKWGTVGLQTYLWDCWCNGQDGRGEIRLCRYVGLDLGCTEHCDPHKSLNKLLFICAVLHCSVVLHGCGIHKDKWAFCTAHLWWTTGDLKHAATTGTPYGPYLTFVIFISGWVSNLVGLRWLGNNANDILKPNSLIWTHNSMSYNNFMWHEMIHKHTMYRANVNPTVFVYSVGNWWDILTIICITQFQFV